MRRLLFEDRNAVQEAHHILPELQSLPCVTQLVKFAQRLLNMSVKRLLALREQKTQFLLLIAR